MSSLKSFPGRSRHGSGLPTWPTSAGALSRTLLEDRFSHPRHAGGIRFLRGPFNKSMEHTRGAEVAAHHAMTRTGKQEEEAPGERP